MRSRSNPAVADVVQYLAFRAIHKGMPDRSPEERFLIAVAATSDERWKVAEAEKADLIRKWLNLPDRGKLPTLNGLEEEKRAL